MMKRILVGVDGSDSAANAMRWAADLATHTAAELVVMNGFGPTEGELDPCRFEALYAQRVARLESWSRSAISDQLEVSTVVEPGDPRPGILAVAKSTRADMIVVGRIGRSTGPGRFHLGSFAEWLAHHTEVPVAIIGGETSPSVQSVLVGVDGSAGSRAAVAWIRDTLARPELSVVAASVHQPILEWTPAGSDDNWRRDLERDIRKDFAAELIAAGIEVAASALSGSNTARLLLRAAGGAASDLIVVGARGLGGFTGLRVGGVALKILHDADRPVVLVPSTVR
jgi:nucleotide-binding universal stress UspA family protein